MSSLLIVTKVLCVLGSIIGGVLSLWLFVFEEQIRDGCECECECHKENRVR
jgi:hypothetical protein